MRTMGARLRCYEHRSQVMMLMSTAAKGYTRCAVGAAGAMHFVAPWIQRTEKAARHIKTYFFLFIFFFVPFSGVKSNNTIKSAFFPNCYYGIWNRNVV